jgi:hypothetical protein
VGAEIKGEPGILKTSGFRIKPQLVKMQLPVFIVSFVDSLFVSVHINMKVFVQLDDGLYKLFRLVM